LEISPTQAELLPIVSEISLPWKNDYPGVNLNDAAEFDNP